MLFALPEGNGKKFKISGELLFLRKIFLGNLAQQVEKITRQLMPSAAPSRPASFVAYPTYKTGSNFSKGAHFLHNGQIIHVL
jgi:hypothetical protein